MRRALAPLLLLALAVPPAAYAGSTGSADKLWPVHCVTDNTSTDPVRVELYWAITCIAPIIP